jgi:hypothetical protein
MMSDVLIQARDRLTNGLDREPPVVELLIADRWIVKSLLQKSIRRGEVEVAQRAALTFLAQKGSAIWRRFIVIAFEDVGAGSADVVAMTVAASTDSSWRKKAGGDAAVAAHLTRLLAEAPKSRSAEHLITSADQHPSFEQERRAVSSSSIADNLAALADKSNSLTHRALAGWCVSGSRDRLKEFLLAEIESLEDAAEPDKELLKVLYLAVDGLDNLDFGQSDEIFAAADIQTWGVLPATAKRYKAYAIGYVLLLKEMGLSVANAESEVASRYGIEANNLHQWRKTIGKSTDPRLQEIILRAERQFRNLQRLNHPPSLDGVLAEIGKAGEMFKKATVKKSVKNFG